MLESHLVMFKFFCVMKPLNIITTLLTFIGKKISIDKEFPFHHPRRTFYDNDLD